MHNHQWKPFSVTLLISLAAHLFILTVLFTVPNAKDMDGYKRVRVKLGTKSKLTEIAASGTQAYSSYSPSAGAETTIGNSNKNVPSVAAVEKLEQESLPAPKEAPKKHSSKYSSEESDANSAVKQAGQKAEVQNITEKTEGSPPAPASKPSTANNDEDGIIIGNSIAQDAGKPASYEQLLPLWLNKFKKHPEEAAQKSLSGIGEVFIKIDRKGKVLLSKIIRSTGAPLLDKSLVQMIADADPVLPVPIDYHPGKKTFSYKISFEFEKPKL